MISISLLFLSNAFASNVYDEFVIVGAKSGHLCQRAVWLVSFENIVRGLSIKGSAIVVSINMMAKRYKQMSCLVLSLLNTCRLFFENTLLK